jgi:HD-like signal output (HDOD) protein
MSRKPSHNVFPIGDYRCDREAGQSLSDRTVIDPVALIAAARTLDPMPRSVARLATVIARGDWAISEIEEIVSFDPALSGRLLQFANSAASASLVPVVTVRSAVIRMGVGTLLAFATATTTRRQLQRAIPEYGLGEDDLWKHSVAAALAAELMQPFTRSPIPPEAFTAAILHDIGKLVLARFIDPPHLAALSAARQDLSRPDGDLELEVLGSTHATLGGLIAREWLLPDRLARGIEFHHTPDDGRDVLCDVVHVADAAANALGIGATLDSRTRDRVLPSVAGRLGLTDDGFRRLCEKLSAQLGDMLERFAA